MVNSELLEKVMALPPDEQVEFIGAVWDSLDHTRTHVTSAERKMLDEALADLAANPDAGIPASESLAKLDLSAERAAFMQSASRLNDLLGDVDIDDIINEFDTLRHEERTAKGM